MRAAPLPADESARLDALRALMILDTPPEERFDRIVRFAADELDMPISMISLIDSDRQWFKARVGTDAAQTARDVSFCGHAILGAETLVIEDASLDARFADNPFVTGGPGIRFYAGAPLSAPDGHRIGALCVIDTRPRQLGVVELAIIECLRDLVNETLRTGEDQT